MADIAKMFANFFLQKSDLGWKNTIFAKIHSDFREIPQTISRKSDSAKNFPQEPDFPNNSSNLFSKIGFRDKKHDLR
jgi:hypothetical protein